MKKKDTTIGFRTSEKFRDEIKDISTKYGIDMSAYINLRLHEAIKKDKKETQENT